jgi:hypothetical protein
MLVDYLHSRKLDRGWTNFRRVMVQAAHERSGEKNIVDLFAAAHAATHMGQCVRTSSCRPAPPGGKPKRGIKYNCVYLRRKALK